MKVDGMAEEDVLLLVFQETMKTARQLVLQDREAGKTIANDDITNFYAATAAKLTIACLAKSAATYYNLIKASANAAAAGSGTVR